MLQYFKKKNSYYQYRINAFLREFLQANYPQPSLLLEALSYSLLSGGKRIRPILSYATAEALAVDLNQADYIAASVEMIHAYSLIHDDLPAMDDDNLRRGLPTCHVKYGDAMAILAGDALQAMAFEVLTQIDASPAVVVQLIKKLSISCGVVGMAGGQALDLDSENKHLQKEQMDTIHQLKTGALIAASVEMVGLLYSGALDGQKLTSLHLGLKQYAQGFGMAFQIIDDVLDVIGSEIELGKTVGSDKTNKKSTYPAIIGLEASQQAAIFQSDYAINQLKDLPVGNFSYLTYLAEYLISRQS